MEKKKIDGAALGKTFNAFIPENRNLDRRKKPEPPKKPKSAD